MERLTRRMCGGWGLVEGCEINTTRGMRSIVERLAAYENTGLEPFTIPLKIISDVISERERQDEKWGEQNHNAFVWSSIIGEEYGEMCKAINEFGFNPTPETEQEIYKEAIQTMASCMAMLECLERNREVQP